MGGLSRRRGMMIPGREWGNAFHWIHGMLMTHMYGLSHVNGYLQKSLNNTEQEASAKKLLAVHHQAPPSSLLEWR